MYSSSTYRYSSIAIKKKVFYAFLSTTLKPSVTIFAPLTPILKKGRLLVAVVWSIWLRRNKRTFDNGYLLQHANIWEDMHVQSYCPVEFKKQALQLELFTYCHLFTLLCFLMILFLFWALTLARFVISLVSPMIRMLKGVYQVGMLGCTADPRWYPFQKKKK